MVGRDIMYPKEERRVSMLQIIKNLFSDLSVFFNDGGDRVYKIFVPFFNRVKTWWDGANLFKRVAFVIVSTAILTPFAYIVGMAMKWTYILFFCAFAPIPF